jgi:hypothetical protein
VRFGISEGFANAGLMAEIGAGWERIMFSWLQIQRSDAQDFSGLGITVPTDVLQAEAQRGIRLTGLLQFTPEWVAANPADGWAAVPRNLYLPFDHPENYFGQFVSRIAQFYAGLVDEWIIWNEPDQRPGDPGVGPSSTWAGSDADFAQLMKVGYLAAKRANRNATVVFPAMTYWVDQQDAGKRPQFYQRFLDIVANDPGAAANHAYHDVLALNLYRKPDDIYRIYGVYKDIQKARGLGATPIWLTETNAMPAYDDDAPCAEQFTWSEYTTTMDQQAAYVIQAFALAAATGFSRMEVYKMVDDNACNQFALWGLTRDDGSVRPAARSLHTAVANFSGFTQVQFVPLSRDPAPWPAWPAVDWSYTPNWQVYQVAFDRPGDQRVTALWNGDSDWLRVGIAKRGNRARALDLWGNEQSLDDSGDSWVTALPGATARRENLGDPDGYHYIGGAPVLIVEEGVNPSAPVVPPTVR